jgi:hypothetical protein
MEEDQPEVGKGTLPTEDEKKERGGKEQVTALQSIKPKADRLV